MTPRGDVQTIFHDAPLCVGFVGNLRFGSGLSVTMSGVYRICLLNVVGDEMGMRPTTIQVVFDEGRVVSVQDSGPRMPGAAVLVSPHRISMSIAPRV